MHPSQRSRKLPYSPADAIAHLSAADPKLARLIQRAGPFTLRLASQQSPFEALTESIIYQQLHGKAAAAIHARLLASFDPASFDPASLNRRSTQNPKPTTHNPTPTPTPTTRLPPLHPTPQQILDCPTPQLRAAGLSANKTLALRDLAAKTLDGTVPTIARIRRMSDAAIIDHLTQVRGIGQWTVEMLLIFRLGRPDVFPTTDYGIRKGFALTFQGLKPTTKVTPAHLPKPADMLHRAQTKHWSPYRSIASWYLWRACDLANPKPTPR